MADIAKDAQKDRKSKEIEAISEKIKNSRLKFADIVVPAISLIILALLGIFVFFPMVKSAIDFRAEYQDIQVKKEKLVALENDLNQLDDVKISEDLINSKLVIPKSLKVSSFIYYIDNLAYEKGLSSNEISAGDIKIASGDEAKKGEFISGVSGPLAYSGTLDNILGFLDDLYNASPYIISAENIELNSSSSSWKVTLNVTGYYVPLNIDEFDMYATFTPYTNYSNIVDIFELKASQLD
jgi:hypothetical protein